MPVEFILDRSMEGPREEHFARAHRILRDNGCHSPTLDSLRRTYDVIKSLCALEKLKNSGAEIKTISMDMFIKQVNGPETGLNITGNGVEFTGWYTELFMFKVAGFIGMSRGVIKIHERMKHMFQMDDWEYLVEHFDGHVLDMTKKEILNRCINFGIVQSLFDLAYSGRFDLDEEFVGSGRAFR